MRRLRHRIFLAAALLATSLTAVPEAYSDAPASATPPWQVLLPAGRIGRFVLRVERAELGGSITQAAAQLARAWAEESRPMLRGGSAAVPTLSRLTSTGIETVTLQAGRDGRVEARRSILDWRDPHNGAWPEAPMPGFVAALAALGATLPGLASLDAGAANLTRVWLSPGDVDTVAVQVERVAAEHGLARLMRFDAPAAAADLLRGGRVIAFGSAGVVAVATFTPHRAGVAVVVHYQERQP